MLISAKKMSSVHSISNKRSSFDLFQVLHLGVSYILVYLVYDRAYYYQIFGGKDVGTCQYHTHHAIHTSKHFTYYYSRQCHLFIVSFLFRKRGVSIPGVYHAESYQRNLHPPCYVQRRCTSYTDCVDHTNKHTPNNCCSYGTRSNNHTPPTKTTASRILQVVPK